MRDKDITLYLTYYSHCMTLHPRAKRQSQFSYTPRMGGTMNRLLFLIVAALLILQAVPAFCINHMDLLTTIQGEFDGAKLGKSICSIDFNGDGVRDLVALATQWNPNGALDTSMIYGKISFFWGSVNFDNIADFSIQGTYNKQYGMGRIINAGDINNDGIEDLCYWGSEQSQEKICIFYGRQNPVASPDVTLTFPHSTIFGWGYLFPLGDINNDNHADIGYVPLNSDYQTASLRVLDGASLTTTILSTIVWASPGSSINGIGDVNNDGIDDYHISRALVPGDNTHSSLTIYYGSGSFPNCDSLLISPDTNSLISPQACPLGDVNGDGIDDFVSFMNWSGGKVWLGSANLSSQWDFVIDDIFTTSDGYDLVHGDFNNDGCEDFMGVNFHYAGDDGIAYVWLGGYDPNGTVDLTIPHSIGVALQFGWARAAGDFNNDGYCDVAISQPYAQSAPLATPGRIFIYLGNAQLADTTVANEDELAPQLQDQWQFTSYPNPLPAGKSLFLRYLGKGYAKPMTKNITLYNLKGQRVFQTQDSSRRETSSISLPELPSGVYILSISNGITRLSSKRIVVY